MPTEFKVSFPELGIYDLAISRVAFELNLFGQQLTVYWYGILYALGFVVALLLALRQAKGYDLSKDDVLDVFLAAIPLSVLGSRLYYVAFSWERYADNLLKILDLRDGGLAFYGGVLGGLLALYLVARAKKLSCLELTDFFVPYLALGQAIGRWGNFFNQEAFGGYTNLPWGMISEGTRRYLQVIGYPYANSPVHPTFLYESLGNIIIFLILHQIRSERNFKGETTAWYLALYGLLRYFTEGLRTDSLFLGQSSIRVSQLLSLLMFLGALVYLILAYRQRKKLTQPEGPALADQLDPTELDQVDPELTSQLVPEVTTDPDPAADQDSAKLED